MERGQPAGCIEIEGQKGGDFRSDESDRLSGKTTEFDSRKLLQLKFDMQFNDCEHGHENEIEIEMAE